jgi:tetratricopeptide (TPR) repeat protein
MTSKVAYDDSLFQLAIQHADAALKINPKRLDILFGKIYVYSRVQDWQNYADLVMAIVDEHKKAGDQWVYQSDSVTDEYVRDELQAYIYVLFETESAPPKYIRIISEKMLTAWPDNPILFSNVGASYALEEDFKTSIEWFEKGEAIVPGDVIILANLAHAYDMLGKSKKAIEYYKKILEHGDDDAKKFAQEQIDKIKKK